MLYFGLSPQTLLGSYALWCSRLAPLWPRGCVLCPVSLGPASTLCILLPPWPQPRLGATLPGPPYWSLTRSVQHLHGTCTRCSGLLVNLCRQLQLNVGTAGVFGLWLPIFVSLLKIGAPRDQRAGDGFFARFARPVCERVIHESVSDRPRQRRSEGPGSGLVAEHEQG